MHINYLNFEILSNLSVRVGTSHNCTVARWLCHNYWKPVPLMLQSRHMWWEYTSTHYRKFKNMWRLDVHGELAGEHFCIDKFKFSHWYHCTILTTMDLLSTSATKVEFLPQSFAHCFERKHAWVVYRNVEIRLQLYTKQRSTNLTGQKRY